MTNLNKIKEEGKNELFKGLCTDCDEGREHEKIKCGIPIKAIDAEWVLNWHNKQMDKLIDIILGEIDKTKIFELESGARILPCEKEINKALDTLKEKLQAKE